MEVAAYREANPPLAADPGKVDLIEWDIDANRPAEVNPRPSGLERELASLLNRHSEENESGTPDFILAGFLIGVLDAYNKTLGERAAWRGESVELPALQRLREDKSQSERVLAKIKDLVDAGVIHLKEELTQTDIYRELMDYRPPPVKDLEQGGLEAGDTLDPDALKGQDGKEVPLVIYTDGQRNEVGTASIQITPGEVLVTGSITGAIPVFGKENISAAYSLQLDEPKDEPLPDRSTVVDPAQIGNAFQRYQQKGLTDNG